MKFAEFSEPDRINHIKEEFLRCIEQFMINPKTFEKELPETEVKTISEYVTTLKPADCTCGECIQMETISARIPAELKPVIMLARKHCEERTY